MNFLDAATEEQIAAFEKKHEITFPVKYKEWLEFSDDRPSEDYIVIGALASGDPIVFEKGKEDISIYNHEDDRIEEDETYEDFCAFLADLDNILEIGG